jgi:hypothetical protein
MGGLAKEGDGLPLAELSQECEAVEIDQVSAREQTLEQNLKDLRGRLASVEDYLDRANALPFVADDLFINFDDACAAAGFEVLRQLSRKTQVLFFTHHRHLVEIAQATLGQSVSVVSLLEEPVVSAA